MIRLLGVLGGVEVITTVLVLCGVVFVALALWGFVSQERYRAPAVMSPVEREWVTREVGERFEELAPRVLRLNRLETAVKSALRDGVEDGAWAGVRGRLRLVGLEGFWRDLACVSALEEEDPAGALVELRRVGVRLDGCLADLEEIGRMLRVGQGVRVPAEGEKDAGG